VFQHSSIVLQETKPGEAARRFLSLIRACDDSMIFKRGLIAIGELSRLDIRTCASPSAPRERGLRGRLPHPLLLPGEAFARLNTRLHNTNPKATKPTSLHGDKIARRRRLSMLTARRCAFWQPLLHLAELAALSSLGRSEGAQAVIGASSSKRSGSKVSVRLCIN